MDLDWWGERTTVASASSFSTLIISKPMLRRDHQLERLLYDWPQGFPRWWLEVMNSSVGTLCGTQPAEIGAAVGH
jgi:hypothetical protein